MSDDPAAPDPGTPASSPASSPAAVAREEAARQLVALAGGIAFVITAVMVERMAADPDFARLVRMRAYRTIDTLGARVGVLAAWVSVRAARAYRAECAG